MSCDEELLRRFAAGDRNALGELADRYEAALLNLAWPMVGSRELAMDAVQETWLRVIRYASSFNGHSSVKTWLYRIAINQCRSARAAQIEPEAPARVSPDDANSFGNDAAQNAVEHERAESIRHAVEQLPPDLREAILLCYMQGLTHAEAAEALEIPIGTVKSRVHAALEALRGKVKA